MNPAVHGFELDVSTLAGTIRTACWLECTARKPGNVHPQASFEDLTFDDFVKSAEVIAPILARSAELGVTTAMLQAVQHTHRQVGTNSNLGLILLLAPLAALQEHELTPRHMSDLLARLTVADTERLYEAIRTASPGGMGQAPDQDVAEMPTVNVLQAMALAAECDLIARQYVTGFRDVLEFGVGTLVEWSCRGETWEQAIVGLHLSCLAEYGDSLIARKWGVDESQEAARRARQVLRAGWPQTVRSRGELEHFDRWLRQQGRRRNPGTTADMVGAILFAAMRTGHWQPPERI